jgi:hypothetical protein
MTLFLFSGVPLLSPKDGNRPIFRTVVFTIYLEFQAMGKADKLSDSECYT